MNSPNSPIPISVSRGCRGRVSGRTASWLRRSSSSCGRYPSASRSPTIRWAARSVMRVRTAVSRRRMLGVSAMRMSALAWLVGNVHCAAVRWSLFYSASVKPDRGRRSRRCRSAAPAARGGPSSRAREAAEKPWWHLPPRAPSTLRAHAGTRPDDVDALHASPATEDDAVQRPIPDTQLTTALS